MSISAPKAAPKGKVSKKKTVAKAKPMKQFNFDVEESNLEV